MNNTIIGIFPKHISRAAIKDFLHEHTQTESSEDYFEGLRSGANLTIDETPLSGFDLMLAFIAEDDLEEFLETIDYDIKYVK